MTKHFIIGFAIGRFAFMSVNVNSAHLNSGCGLLTVFDRDACADDVSRAGGPPPFMSAAILDYLFEFSPHALFMDPAIGVIATVLCGWLNLAEVSKISQQNLPAPVSLCYNADTMQYEFRFANDNNNNDNDDPKIVGRSFAG